jgi:hypothetical protein
MIAIWSSTPCVRVRVGCSVVLASPSWLFASVFSHLPGPVLAECRADGLRDRSGRLDQSSPCHQCHEKGPADATRGTSRQLGRGSDWKPRNRPATGHQRAHRQEVPCANLRQVRGLESSRTCSVRTGAAGTGRNLRAFQAPVTEQPAPDCVFLSPEVVAKQFEEPAGRLGRRGTARNSSYGLIRSKWSTAPRLARHGNGSNDKNTTNSITCGRLRNLEKVRGPSYSPRHDANRRRPRGDRIAGQEDSALKWTCSRCGCLER